MVGVNIQTAVRTGPSNAATEPASQMFLVGVTERGPVTSANLVTSLSEFEAIYGGYISTGYAHPAVQTFFEEGGTRAWIARTAATASAPTSGALALLNSAATPATCITINANGPGSWSTAIKVVVATGTVTGTKIVTLFDNDVLFFSSGNCSTSLQIVGRINAHPVASKKVSAVDAGTATLPANISTSNTLSAGTAGAPLVSDIVNTANNLFLESYGTGVIICPESSHTTVQTGLAVHANSYNRLAFLYGPFDDTVTEAETAGNALATADESSEHVAYFYPWVYVPTSTPGVNRLIPPDAYAAAKRAVAHNQVGPHQPGAGLISAARFVNGVATDINKTNGDILDTAYVNAIRLINNSVRIYGARSASSDTTNFRYITAQDVVNKVVVEANNSLEDLVFSVIDGRNTVFASVESKLYSVLEPLRAVGALFEAFDALGKQIDFGYTVKCDSTINPVTQLADGLIKARVGLRVSSVGDKIEVDIIKSNLTKSVV